MGSIEIQYHFLLVDYMLLQDESKQNGFDIKIEAIPLNQIALLEWDEIKEKGVSNTTILA